ncbi:uncharacterized protein LOC115700225 [Cannabis sativa]|uniref:uncharacterized protein LOC115700225 n=1 Tax=Cannabis sativa TaxID=3483 RepID=UPI0029CA565D|nr:uncharacterized protein LOC115700225 [Cannabis sativa]
METDTLAWDVDLDDNSVFWNTLWKLCAPPKVKDLLWRAATNCLPTKSRLRSIYVPIDTICTVCKVTDETIYHFLVDCSFAKACWQQLTAGVNLTAVLLPTAQALLADWTQAQDLTFNLTVAFLTDVNGAETWAKPAENILKINVDVAIFSETATYSFARVIRDETGALVEAFTCCRSGVLQPEMVEALGVKEALSWVKRKDWRKVVIETDSLTVVQALRSSIPMVSYFGSIISDYKMLLNDLQDVYVNFIRHSANSVAHFLARASYLVADRVIRSSDVTSNFNHVITMECN